jgi:uncharacterized protein (TIGR02596 family)
MKHLTTHPRRGFTLIESLAVVGILSIIVALATPAMLNAIKANRLTYAGELITGKLVEAQGLALTFSSDVELRIYQTPEGYSDDGTSGQFLQLYQWVENDASLEENDDVASLKQVGARELLPEGIAISDLPEFSSLWKLELQSDKSSKEERQYIAIRFRPDGSTDLKENEPWHLTLVDSVSRAKTELPLNFYTVQIDPVTSKLEVFRPE